MTAGLDYKPVLSTVSLKYFCFILPVILIFLGIRHIISSMTGHVVA